jgi:hypothetical protein
MVYIDRYIPIYMFNTYMCIYGLDNNENIR